MPNSRATARRLRPSTSTAHRTRPYISTWNIPPVSHKPPLPGNGSRNKDPAVDYFYSAAKHRSRGVLLSIFAPALIRIRYFLSSCTVFYTIDTLEPVDVCRIQGVAPPDRSV